VFPLPTQVRDAASRAHISPSRLAPVILSGISNTAKRGVREARERVRVGLWCVGHCSIQDLPCPQPNRDGQGKRTAGCVGELGAGWLGTHFGARLPPAQGHTQPTSVQRRAKRSGQARMEVSGQSVSRWAIVPPLAAPFQILGQSRCAKKGRGETQTKFATTVASIKRCACVGGPSLSMAGIAFLFCADAIEIHLDTHTNVPSCTSVASHRLRQGRRAFGRRDYDCAV
jgi:hypothetical protein